MFYSRSNPKLSDYQNKLNTSSYSSKSRGSFKEISPETRNITPNNLNRPLTARNEYTNPSKVKQLLSNLIQPDQQKTSTQLFGQNLIQKKQLDSTSSRCDSLFSSRISNFGKQNAKSPQNNETFLKSGFIVTETDQDKKLHQNLYYISNKQNEFNSSQQIINKNQKLLTISQIAQQCKKNSITPKRQNTVNNENINNLNNINSNSKNKQQSKQIVQVGNIKKNKTTYVDTFNILKQKFDNNIQSNQTKNITSGKKQNEKSIPIKSTTQSSTVQKIDDVTQQNIYKSLLQKEQIWNDIINLIDNPNQFTLATKCTQLQKLIRLISEKNYSEYLFRIEPQILEIFLYESFACYLIISDYLQDQTNQDHNMKNLIQYIINSNLYVLQVLEGVTTNPLNLNLLKQRIDLRIFNVRKVCPKGRQALQKNNYIIKSILSLMYFIQSIQKSKRIDEITRPEVFMILSRITTTPDQYTLQQKKINSMIEQIMPLDLERALAASNKEYTLVLDLDETLVHYQEFPKGGGQFLVRPFVEEFLEQLSKYYEIIIFTAALPDYANFIIDIIDKKGFVKQRLYRDKTIFKDQVYIKDLSILNRSLSKTIIVDNMPENFQLQPENGIYIQSWFGDTQDRALKDLQPLLEQIAIKKCKDIRVALNQFREQMIERVQMGIKNPYQYLQLN
ncbi:unnamed protein product (macronuclear) [Paramecium tetraurelia]|uniref:FCP1 homology domain-containing protein n=1 Tax=Paramecium tetraurelia TaxID=5888 RepID=A0DKA5_PARTE|nr:uncharacterized protein GSPATT00017801001 [Paramecium tetraurelia]CAK83472.1 unnamed protein product [Paramecium tetraurelia]|eukprot:XP_001450869.1 hypothetical protein (macronuclear) [Paramecium tetraurelia strain d4-2]